MQLKLHDDQNTQISPNIKITDSFNELHLSSHDSAKSARILAIVPTSFTLADRKQESVGHDTFAIGAHTQTHTQTHRFPCKIVFAVMPQISALEQPKHCDKELKIWACSKISKKWDMPEKLHFTEGCLPERVYIVQRNVVVGFMVNDIRSICRQF